MAAANAVGGAVVSTGSSSNGTSSLKQKVKEIETNDRQKKMEEMRAKSKLTLNQTAETKIVKITKAKEEKKVG